MPFDRSLIYVRVISRKAELYVNVAAFFPGDNLAVTKNFAVR